jgi:hypothetical protein
MNRYEKIYKKEQEKGGFSDGLDLADFTLRLHTYVILSYLHT